MRLFKINTDVNLKLLYKKRKILIHISLNSTRRGYYFKYRIRYTKSYTLGN